MTDHLDEAISWGVGRQTDGTFSLSLAKKHSRDTYTLTKPKLEALTKMLASFLAGQAAS